MSENVGSIVYEVDANTSGLVAAQREVEVSNSKMQKGFAQTDKAAAGMQKGMDSAAKSTKPLAKGFNGVEKGSNKLGNSIRQASMQLSQVAQQGSVTGNYMQALAIQLPDLALGFGTVGIIAGALAGTLGVTLIDSMRNSGKSATDLRERISSLREEFRETNKVALSSLDKFELGVETKSLEKALNDLDSKDRSIRKAARDLIIETTGIDDGFFSPASTGDVMSAAKSRIKENGQILRLAEQKEADKNLAEKAKFKDEEGEQLAAAYAKRQEAARASIEQVRQQFQDEQTLAEEQLEERLTAIDDAEISIAEKEQAEYEARALHAQRLADLEKQRTDDEQAQIMKRLTMKKMELAGYTQLGGQLTNLMSVIGAENSAIGKAIFLADQALAVANIIVSTQQAAAQAKILDPTGSLSASITASGYASAAIAGGVAVGQTFSGRQTGGPTEANTPYRVGEAGPELFTSGGRQFLIGGEKGNVTPTNQLGGAAAPQVNVVVNNNTSSNVSVSQEQDGNNVTIQMLVADFAEGGPVSRAMASSYNTKRKTT